MQKTKKKLLKIISYKKIIGDIPDTSEIYNDTYKYPIHDEVIRGLIEGQNGVQKIEEYLENNDVNFLNTLEEYKEIIGNGYFNPYKPYQLSQYYIKNNYYDKLGIIYQYKDTPRLKRNIIHVGDKGSGKTALQNCWLNENNNKLESNNIYWVRCDGHKLYELWLDCYDILEKKKNEGEDRLIFIQEYLDLQFVYVFAKYCMNESRPFFEKMLSHIKEKNEQFDYPMGKWDKNATGKRDLYLTILEIKDTITKKEAEKAIIKPGFSYLLDEVMRKSFVSHRREMRRWLAVSHVLQSIMTKGGYWFLKIVDGVDNVHINEKNTAPYYERMIRECHKFMSQRPPSNEIRLLSLRERTLIDIGRIPVTNTAPTPITTRKIDHVPSCLKEISDKRYEFFKDKFDHDSLFGKIFNEVSHTIPFHINDLHHNNVRTFLYNKTSLIMQVYYRIKQLGGRPTNIKSNIELLDARNRFLNGRLFLDTFRDFSELNNELGLCCMNIFYFNIEDYPCNTISKWLGLCKTRILQLLIEYTTIKDDSLTEFLSIGIGYPKDLVQSDIDDLRAFGMIDTKVENKELVYIINHKGISYLARSYSDIDTIYYFALDTPLPVKFVEAGLVNGHENKFSRRTNFPYASISTGVTFMKFLNSVNVFETKQLKKNKNKFQKFKLPHSYELSLPFENRDIYLQLINSGLHQINASDDINIANINLYINKATEQFH